MTQSDKPGPSKVNSRIQAIQTLARSNSVAQAHAEAGGIVDGTDDEGPVEVDHHQQPGLILPDQKPLQQRVRYRAAQINRKTWKVERASALGPVTILPHVGKFLATKVADCLNAEHLIWKDDVQRFMETSMREAVANQGESGLQGDKD